MTTPHTEHDANEGKEPAEQLAMRFLIDHPVGRWLPLSISRAMALYRGEKVIAELANQTVRVATVHVVMDGKRIKSLMRLQIEHWKLDSDGRVDQEEAMSKIVEKLNRGAAETADQHEDASDTLSDADVKAIRAALGLASTTT